MQALYIVDRAVFTLYPKLVLQLKQGMERKKKRQAVRNQKSKCRLVFATFFFD